MFVSIDSICVLMSWSHGTTGISLSLLASVIRHLLSVPITPLAGTTHCPGKLHRPDYRTLLAHKCHVSQAFVITTHV